jgi:heme exporter protein D
MSWDSLSAFLHMGGYGFYVWGAYGVTVALLLVEITWVRARRRTIVQRAGLIRDASGHARQ